MAHYTKREIEESNIFIRELYGYRCIRCSRPRVKIVHEIEPRSTRPSTWMFAENRVVLCSICHEHVHAHGALNFVDELRSLQAAALGVSYE